MHDTPTTSTTVKMTRENYITIEIDQHGLKKRFLHKIDGLWPWLHPSVSFKEKYQTYLLSPHWEYRRWSCFLAHNCKCNGCIGHGRVTVHHLTYDNIYNETDDDLIPLCWKCHKRAEVSKIKDRQELISYLNSFECKSKRPHSSMAFSYSIERFKDRVDEAENSGSFRIMRKLR